MSHQLHHHAPFDHQAPATRGVVLHWAKYYDSFVSLFTLGQRARLRRATVDLAHIQPGATVLEVGCGTGDVALAAKERAGSTGAVYGIDPSPEMIAVARSKAARSGAKAEFQVGVIEALAFPDATFDVVLSSLMMHHLPDDLKRRGLAEIARVLKPGGWLVIIDMKRPTTPVAHVMSALFLHGAMSVGIQDLPELLAAAGFTNVRTGDVRPRMLGFVIGNR
jgi:demethylmenaquinone methyltransferase/2-methoxy-6-polyprenyl-1,4-benzoquinol methylase/phosphoethanolamine N-methyltransferase